MTIVGVGGDGRSVILTLTDREHQVAKEMEPLDAIRLAHRLMEEALALNAKTPRAEARGAGGVMQTKGCDDGTLVSEAEAHGKRIELTKTQRVMLRMARFQAGIMSKQMALDIGVSRQRFSNYETGARTVPYPVLVAWQKALFRE